MIVCDKEKCTGCKACIDACLKDAITFMDEMSETFALINEEKCIHCNACESVCQVHNPLMLSKPIEWHQGWADKEIRENSTSGGYATAIARHFIKNGGVVASCKLREGDFRFDIIRNIEELDGVSGSKYVKSNPEGIYKKVKKELLTGNNVLFIGLPCQVAAMKQTIKGRLSKRLYTIDLICHGTPSVKLLSKALYEYGVNINDLKDIQFRRNNKFNLEEKLKQIVPAGVTDCYTIGFLNSLFYTKNCYSCVYAQEARVGDITLGDSWGSNLKEEEKKGISLVLIQNEKGNELLEGSGLVIKDVDLTNAIKSNCQLSHPSVQPDNWKNFIEAIKKGKSFKAATARSYPKTCIKQGIKAVLIKLRLYHGEINDYVIGYIPKKNV